MDTHRQHRDRHIHIDRQTDGHRDRFTGLQANTDSDSYATGMGEQGRELKAGDFTVE